MGGLLKPIKKLFKKKNLKKIGLGVGIAAAALVTGGALFGMASGVGPAAGIAGTFGKLGSALGIGAAAAPTSTAFTSAQLAAGGVLPPGVATGAGTTAAGIAGGAAGTTAISGSAPFAAPAGLSASMLPASATPTAVPLTGMTGTGLGPAALAFDFGTVAGGGASGDIGASLGGTPALSNAIAGAAGGEALNIGAQTAPLTRQTPVTPAAAGRRPTNVTPLTPVGQPQGLGGPIVPSSNPAFDSISTGGGASGDTGFNIPGSGLFQTAASGIGAAGDWWSRLPPIVQFSLLRGVERGFAGDPLERQFELEDRAERRRMRRTRAPVFSGGRFIG